MAETLSPFVYWGQKTDQIFLKIDLRDVENENVNLTEDGLTLSAEGYGVRGQNYYSIDIEFYHSVDPEKSKYRVLDRCIEFQIKKSGEGEIWPRLTYAKIKLPWLKIDFDKVAYDESESEKEEEKNIDEEQYMKQIEQELLGDKEEDDQVPDIKTCYLFIYNLVQFIGFTYIFTVLTYNFFKDTWGAFSSTFEIAGAQMLFVQTAAFLEIIHPLLGLVKSSPLPALMQVLGRNFALFVVIGPEPRLYEQPVIFVLFLVWSSIEVIRYPFYMLSVLGKKNDIITWFRYTAWIPLYPLGIITEATIIWMAASYYEQTEKFCLFLPNSYNFAFYFPWFLKAYIAVFIPAGYYMMSSMYRQRQKSVGKLKFTLKKRK